MQRLALVLFISCLSVATRAEPLKGSAAEAVTTEAARSLADHASPGKAMAHASMAWEHQAALNRLYPGLYKASGTASINRAHVKGEVVTQRGSWTGGPSNHEGSSRSVVWNHATGEGELAVRDAEQAMVLKVTPTKTFVAMKSLPHGAEQFTRSRQASYVLDAKLPWALRATPLLRQAGKGARVSLEAEQTRESSVGGGTARDASYRVVVNGTREPITFAMYQALKQRLEN